MKSYGQYCAIARGLDIVGDRWTLLIVRELLDGPRRYGEIRDGLPGIATNLLSQRLRTLTDADVLDHSGGRYALTEWGEGLRDVVHAVGRWAMPLMATPPGDEEHFRSIWMRRLVAIEMDEPDPRRPDGVVELRIDGADTPVTLVTRTGAVRVIDGVLGSPDAVVTGPPEAVGALVGGFVDLDDASTLGAEVDGDIDLVARLTRPHDGPGASRDQPA